MDFNEPKLFPYSDIDNAKGRTIILAVVSVVTRLQAEGEQHIKPRQVLKKLKAEGFNGWGCTDECKEQQIEQVASVSSVIREHYGCLIRIGQRERARSTWQSVWQRQRCHQNY